MRVEVGTRMGEVGFWGRDGWGWGWNEGRRGRGGGGGGYTHLLLASVI